MNNASLHMVRKYSNFPIGHYSPSPVYQFFNSSYATLLDIVWTASDNNLYTNEAVPLLILIEDRSSIDNPGPFTGSTMWVRFSLDIDLIHGYHRSGSIIITERMTIRRSFSEAMGFAPVLCSIYFTELPCIYNRLRTGLRHYIVIVDQ